MNSSYRTNGGDVLLERATQLLKGASVPEGPSPEFNSKLMAELGRLDTAVEAANNTGLTRRFMAMRFRNRCALLATIPAVVFLMFFFTLFTSDQASAAWKSMVDTIQDFKTVKYRYVVELPDKKPSAGLCMFSLPDRRREERSNGSVMVQDKTRILELQVKERTALLTKLTGEAPATSSEGFLGSLRNDILNVNTDPKIARQPLGEKTLEGRQAVGYRIVSPTRTTVVWADSTGLPLLVEITNSKYLSPGAKVTLSDFEFNLEFEESLFVTQPPVDYQVRTREMSLAEPTERDLVDALSLYSELSKGSFPEHLDTRGLQELAIKMGYDKKMPSAKETERWMEHCEKLVRGFAFALGLPPEASATYVGKDIEPGMNAPVFWYKPVGTEKYRVISSDLSIRPANVAPDAK